jgi:hypothetical protein
MMARHSVVMKDMFDMPREVAQSDSVHVVPLDDPHDAFSLLLGYIFPLGPPTYHQEPHLQEVLTLLPLTQKYGMDPLHQAFLDVCESRLPQSMETLPKLNAYNSLTTACCVILAAQTVHELRKYLPLSYYVVATREWDLSLMSIVERLTPEARFAIHNGRHKVHDLFAEDALLNGCGLLEDVFVCTTESSTCIRQDYPGVSVYVPPHEDSCHPTLHPIEELVLRLASKDSQGQACGEICRAKCDAEKALLERLHHSLPSLFNLPRNLQ